ncbi:MAG: ribonuclease P protein component 1 [Nitrososphaerota archaeon]|jgi:ribonuclease P protein subunit POP4|uniref:ribonuclease P protein component 1 n=1 Tax=Candidatus Bathycorpusculum sp. TaxID=2994959 RepID=UPI00282A9109|nr:ribonuclease P protein component 1 [Candidatus Termiticorpusculum sp.]MCL2257578.1 ribonuclease P protein component 1 [Candidatus Termiticorpusculum sp.]MCL2292287.1 ribonuclease P protein component 1 [Candidatus Termiticorpusculum sp.]MDR0461267.1 ribonuclease P protein component 1 [Nitrososphaerota archaeon]
MKVTPDIIRYEFIGTAAHVAHSNHFDYLGLSGRVIGETKNTFTLNSENKIKRVIKDSAVFNFTFNDGTTVEIDGKLLIGRPEDRLKKSIKRLW